MYGVFFKLTIVSYTYQPVLFLLLKRSTCITFFLHLWKEKTPWIFSLLVKLLQLRTCFFFFYYLNVVLISHDFRNKKRKHTLNLPISYPKNGPVGEYKDFIIVWYHFAFLYIFFDIANILFYQLYVSGDTWNIKRLGRSQKENRKSSMSVSVLVTFFFNLKFYSALG